MSIESIKAKIMCDGCAQAFELSLDRALKLDVTGYADLDDYVRDLVRGPNQEYGIHTSVQGDHLLCVKCSKVVDDAFPETVDLTYDQVAAALNKHAGV